MTKNTRVAAGSMGVGLYKWTVRCGWEVTAKDPKLGTSELDDLAQGH